MLEFFDVRREAGFGFAVLTQAVFLSREGIGSAQRLTCLVGRGVRAGDSGAA